MREQQVDVTAGAAVRDEVVVEVCWGFCDGVLFARADVACARLNVSHNQLTTLPESLAQLPRLER